MNLLLRIITGALSAYMLLLFIRIIISWLGGSQLGKPYQMLSSITDPYLNYFRRFTFLTFGRMDFSPMAGILLLVIVLNIFSTIASYGSITFGVILAIVLTALWSAVSFLLTLFIILAVIRFIAIIINSTTQSPLMVTLETILSPLTNIVYHKIFKNSNIAYTTCLAVTGGILLIFRLGGNALVNGLSRFFMNLSY